MVLYESLMKAMSLHHSERRTKTLTYKLLESKHKTAVQYWQSDGTAWPELQKVSLSILNVGIKCSLTEKLLGTFIRSYASASVTDLLGSWSSSRHIIKHLAVVTVMELR